MQFKDLVIGVPKEIMPAEGRVALTPEKVKYFVEQGAIVQVQAGAGLGSYYTDDMYKSAGARIVNDPTVIYDTSSVILKVKEPQFNKEKNCHEANMINPDAVLICFLHPASPPNLPMVKTLADRGIVSLTLDGIPRIPEANPMDPLISMSIAAGYKSVIMAASHLPRFVSRVESVVGERPGANVLVVGAGVAGVQAITTAKGLGAKVYALDIRPEAMERAEQYGAEALHFHIPSEIAVGEGGKVKQLPEEWFSRMRLTIKENLPEMDIVILSALVPNEKAPILITEEMVHSMKQGSVIVDISIDQGGNCALTKAGEIYQVDGVTIIGTKNIPGSVPQDATWMFSENISGLVSHLVEDGRVNIDPKDPITASALVSFNGKIVHEGTLASIKQSVS